MDKLPNELLDRICSFLKKRELWAVIQVSSSYRRLAMLPYLSRFGISRASIQSGTLVLSDSFFLILVVAGICPIQRLVCFQEVVSGSQLRYRLLASILAVAPPIPDIVIYNRHYILQRTRRETAYLLSHIPSSASNTLLVLKGSSTHISRPRSSPPIRWKLLPPPFGSLNLSTTMNFLVVIFGIPLLFAYLVSAVVNIAVVSMWVYRRITSPPWPQDERIIEDTGLLAFDDWLRIQILPEKQMTLVTLTEKRWPALVLRPVPGLTGSAYSAVLASLDLGMHLERLTVYSKADLAHPEVMAFLKRHPYLTSIQFESHSIQSSSLTQIPVLPDPENKAQVLVAPPPYIPYLLPAAPNAQRISLLFSPVATRAVFGLRGTTFDLPAYRTALEAIAALPGTQPLTLNFTFRLTAAALPWLSPHLPSSVDVEATDGALLPETRLARVHTLCLFREGLVRYRAADVRALVRWLALFPKLQHLTFAYGSLEKISADERASLVEAICAACKGIRTPQDIAFNISNNN
ncbi:hypothetical protein C8R45DRAFT_929752 [Mycena sanguinolenta]|nr:hypothetical protein C8R45DRAFT_929752 [Mycena sanguinolenta]